MQKQETLAQLIYRTVLEFEQRQATHLENKILHKLEPQKLSSDVIPKSLSSKKNGDRNKTA